MSVTKYQIIIGIDPDVSKSGVAILNMEDKSLKVENLTFPQLIKLLMQNKAQCNFERKNLCVVVEASWLIKSNWHLSGYDGKRISASKGYDVGRNHETGRKIVEMAQDFDIETIEHRPLRKCWRGRDGKITQEELEYFTGLQCRTNQDERDAALLAWSFAGLPIRQKTWTKKKD